jgi:aryl-alcohol dehydrogenase-like predicted oxidoreductase
MTLNFPRKNLASTYSISRVLKGGWQLSGGHGYVNEHQAVEDMRTFVEAGITTFDCADIYTGVEELIGKFLKEYKDAIKSGELPAVQIHTKYVPDLNKLSTLTKAYTEAIIDRSLKRIGVEQLDLVQFHWWDYSIPRYIEVIQHLVEIQKAGKIRYIGVTNMDAARLREILENGIEVVSNQVQYSVLDQRPEEDLLGLCQQYSMKLLCYGAIAGGFLTEHYLGSPEPKEPLENRSLTKYKLIIDEFGGWELFQGLLQCLKRISDKHKIGITEVAIKYLLQKPLVAGVIVGARNATHIGKLQRLNSFDLDKDDLNAIVNIISRSKGPTGGAFEIERNLNGPHGRIMKYNLNEL